MKKIGIVTLYGNSNFGNKLQNYAIQKKVEELGYYVETIRNYNSSYNHFRFLFNRIRYIIKISLNKIYRNSNFHVFEKKYMHNSRKVYYANENNESLNGIYSFFIIGSDQVWNPRFGLQGNFRFLDFTNNKSAFSASFGIDDILDENCKSVYRNGLNSLKYISVREDKGKEIIKNLTGRHDVEVLIDPTMLLTSKEWDNILNKPNKLDENKKYILCYFLGDLSKDKKNEIQKIAKKYDCGIINLLDKDDLFYDCGPSEFLYLEKNAFLVCTDSFHSCVFAFIYNRPFVIFDREGSIEKMNSRLDTLIKKFRLETRKYNGKEITKDNLNHDYTEAYKILNKERKKANDFIKKVLK